MLLIVTLAAFVIDRARHGSERRRTVRLLALGLVPGGARLPRSRTSARRSSTAVITLAVLFVAGIRWTHFAALGGVAARRSRSCW